MPTRGQLSLLTDLMALAEAVTASQSSYGEVFTRRWVVELILDLVGYTADRDLGSMTIVEPSCGSGAFLGPILERLIDSAQGHGRDLNEVAGSIQAFDVLEANADIARKAVSTQLQEAGLDREPAEALAKSIVRTADFLLHPHLPSTADFVVGNPPYVRLEDVPAELMSAYRDACTTMRGRSDVYVGFFERGLHLLKPDGRLGFICADRWMRNQYGAGLRKFIGRSYAVDTVITMHETDAFEERVSAYPAIVVLRRGGQERANVVQATKAFGAPEAQRVARWARGGKTALRSEGFEASRLDNWFRGSDLWPTGSPDEIALLAGLESRFPPLEDPTTGTRVGIGVATGRDDTYLTSDAGLVEEDRLLPLVKSADIASGVLTWSGTYLVNPWDETGIVDLGEYPKLRQYFSDNAPDLRSRHVAARRPDHWYRTIDRVDPLLLRRPKLLLPDIKAASHPVLDSGQFYPHHNLYFVTSEAWDLEVLGGILLSDIANLFVGAYCVRMRGDSYRFQAQYLRRIRVPELASVSTSAARRLAKAFRQRDVAAASAVACELYGVEFRRA